MGFHYVIVGPTGDGSDREDGIEDSLSEAVARMNENQASSRYEGKSFQVWEQLGGRTGVGKQVMSGRFEASGLVID